MSYIRSYDQASSLPHTDNDLTILQDQIVSSVSRLNTKATIINEEEYYPFGDSSLRTFAYKRNVL